MAIYSKLADPYSRFPIKLGSKLNKFLILPAIIGIGLSIGLIGLIDVNVEANKLAQEIQVDSKKLLTLEQNTLIPSANPSEPEPKVIRKLQATITAYSSTVWQTDSTPFITASNTRVKDGVIANNLLPFGTKIRIPELYGDKIFVVEDRMHSRLSDYNFDIWFETYQDAKNFGVKKASIEVLEI